MQHCLDRTLAVDPLVSQRVEPQLEALVRGALRAAAALLVRASLVVDDDRAVRCPIDAVPSPDDPILAEHEAEALLDKIGDGLSALLLVEATK